jgi:hypothetical protein
VIAASARHPAADADRRTRRAGLQKPAGGLPSSPAPQNLKFGREAPLLARKRRQRRAGQLEIVGFTPVVEVAPGRRAPAAERQRRVPAPAFLMAVLPTSLCPSYLDFFVSRSFCDSRPIASPSRSCRWASFSNNCACLGSFNNPPPTATTPSP